MTLATDFTYRAHANEAGIGAGAMGMKHLVATAQKQVNDVELDR